MSNQSPRAWETDAYHELGHAFFLLSKGITCYTQLIGPDAAFTLPIGVNLRDRDVRVGTLMGLVGEYVLRERRRRQLPNIDELRRAFKNYKQFKAAGEIDALIQSLVRVASEADTAAWHRASDRERRTLVGTNFKYYVDEAISVAERVHLSDEWRDRAATISDQLIKSKRAYIVASDSGQVTPFFGSMVEQYLDAPSRELVENNVCVYQKLAVAK